MRTLSHQEIVNIEEGKKLSESLGRGSGSMFFWRERKTVQFYYRYYRDKRPVLIHIGPYKESRSKGGFSLLECREKAFQLAKTRRDIAPVDLKNHLDLKAHKSKLEHEEALRQRKIAASTGTFDDLLQSYVQQMKFDGKSSFEDAEAVFKKNIYKAHPHLLKKKARDITPDEIVDILAPIHARDARVQSNRCRAYLHAAFATGAKSDYDPARRGEKRFNLTGNPVTLVKKDNSAEKADDRVLSNSEVKDFYQNIHTTNKVGVILSSLVRFMFATGGQRPKQLIHVRWKDCDFERRTLCLIERKGKGGKRKHIIPLTARAIRILRLLQQHNGDLEGPFYTAPEKLVRLDSLKNVFVRWHEKRCTTASLNYKPEPEMFRARDIRRTVNYLLTDAGVRPEDSNLLQSHGQTGVVIKHYDRHHHLPTKRDAMRKYDNVLSKVIRGQKIYQER